MTILDCTFRDGGYYNDWDFDPQLVSNYLRAVSGSCIDVIEIGFRAFPENRFLGPFAYSTDEFLLQLALPETAKIAVMVNASELVKYPEGPRVAIDRLFKNTKDSPVSLVRIASHINQASAVLPSLKRLKELGYQTGLNLMQVSRFSLDNLRSVVKEITQAECVDVLYFADSLGNMRTLQVKDCVTTIASEWPGPIGIHAHNNMGQALSNTLDALDAGATWADATMLGMGRGAGNAQMEFLLYEMERRNVKKYNPVSVIPVVMEDFKKLQKKYDWGANPLYYISAKDEVHPTYVQTMYNDMQYDLPSILGALSVLKDMDGHSYSQEGLVGSIGGNPSDGIGQWVATDWLKGRDVLLLGAGQSAAKHSSALNAYIKRNNIAVLCLNTTPQISPELVCAYVACHPTRILMDFERYATLPNPVIIPVSTLPDYAQKKLSEIKVFDYGLKFDRQVFEVRDNGCTISALVVAAYGLAIATSSGANRVLLAGFDGFDSTDSRQKEMVEVFEKYQKTSGALPLLAVTPTNFPIPQGSIYSPEI